MNTVKKLVILDEYLDSKVGHYYEYDKTVIQSLALKGVSSALYAKSTVDKDIQEELSCIPWFHHNPGMWIRKIKVLGALMYRFSSWHKTADQIRGVVRKEARDGMELFFVPNILWYNIIPYALAFGNTSHHVKLLFRTSVNDVIDVGFPFKQLIPSIYTFCIARLRRNPNVSFVTDSEVIAEEFTRKFNHRMEVLPIPHVFEVGNTSGRNIRAPFRLYLPGAARIEKGIVLITKALELLDKKNPPFMKRIQLCIQIFGDKEKEELESCAKVLRSLSCEVLFYGKLSSEEYKEQFSRADVILIPYLNDKGYKARTSGVLAEAISTAKPFITAKDSWMDTQVKRYCTGYAIQDSSVEELAVAIEHVIDSYASYKTKAEQAKDLWLSFHSKERYAEVFLNG